MGDVDIPGFLRVAVSLEFPSTKVSSLQVIENCPVTGIQVRTDDFGVRRVAAVETEHGTIQTPCVINCAGRSHFFCFEGPTRVP